MPKTNKATRRPLKRRLERRKQVNFLLRDIDSELWEAVKKRAGDEGRSLRWVILELLFVYANHELDFSL